MIVVDTHIIIWDALKPELLSPNAGETIAQANQEGGIIFCSISLWEIAMLMNKGRIQVDVGYQAFIKLIFQSNKYIYQGLTPEIAERSTQFGPTVNKDPADRIIAATAIIKNFPLVTADENLRQAENIITIW